MNVNEHAEELYKTGKVSELIEYFTELFSENAVSYTQYGYVYDTERYTSDDISKIGSLGLGTNKEDCFEGFNMVSVGVLIKKEELTLKTAKRIYTVFQTEDGKWRMIGELDQTKNDNGGKFKSMNYNTIVSFFTDLSLQKEEEFTYLQQAANDELIDVYTDMVNILDLVHKLFMPNSNGMSKSIPSYNRYILFLKPLKPIFDELGFDISQRDTADYWKNNDNVKKALSVSKSQKAFKFHITEFDYNGIVYELYRDYGTANGFILAYSNVEEELESHQVVDRIQEIYDNAYGIEYFNSVFEEINNVDPDFVPVYMRIFTSFTDFIEQLSPLRSMDNNVLEFSKARMTMLSTAISQNEVFDIISNGNSSDVIRLCFAEYRKWKAWFDTNKIIHLQDTETLKILTFDNLTAFEKQLEIIYNEKLKSLKK